MPPKAKKQPAVDRTAVAAAETRTAKEARGRRRWAAALVIGFFVAAWIDNTSRTPDLTIPRTHRKADCDPTAIENAHHLLMCKGAGAHNAELMSKFVERARAGLLIDGNAEKWKYGGKAAAREMANALVDYYTALTMRHHEYFTVHKVVHDYLMHLFGALACTKVMDQSEWRSEEGHFRVPPILCTEAQFVDKAPLDAQGYDPTELMKTAQRMALLYTLFGSEYHEAAVAMLAVLPVGEKRITVPLPDFARHATLTYLRGEPGLELMTSIWKTPKVARPLLRPIVDKIVSNFNIMCTRDPPPEATWNETFFVPVLQYNHLGYMYATRTFHERWHYWAITKMRTFNGDFRWAIGKHSFYVTAIIWPTLVLFSDYLPAFLFPRGSLIPFIFLISAFIIWNLAQHFPGCPLFTVFPELKPSE